MKTRSITCLTALCVLSIATVATAATHDWDAGGGADTDWSTAANWHIEDGGPLATENAVLGRDYTATVTQAGEVCYTLYLGYYRTGWSSGNATIDINSGDLTANHGTSAALFGYRAGETGRMNVNGGAFDATGGAGTTYLGVNGTGILDQNGGTVTLGTTRVGDNSGSTGTVTIDNGSMNMATTYVGHDNGATGSITLNSGGSLSVIGSQFNLGESGAGTLTVNGGVATLHQIRMGNNSSDTGVGTMNINAGTLDNAYYTYVGLNGAGTVVQTDGDYTVGGGASSQHGLVLGYYGGSSGTYTISGGSLSVSSDDSTKGIRVGISGDGTLKVVGDDATISTDYYNQSANGTLEAELDADGISVITASGSATLGGTLTVLDSGVAPGTYTLLSAAGGLGGSFATVNLPSGDWSYSIGANDLTVTVIPEPATLGLFGFIGASMLWIRRKRMI